MGTGDDLLGKKANTRAKQKEARGRRKSAGGSVDMRRLDHQAVVALYIVAGTAGGAVRLGRTRDGGALAVGCYAGEDYATEYIKPNEVQEDAIREIVEAWWPEALEDYDALLEKLRNGHALV